MTFAEIISIGNELLIGETLNTNAAWMGQQLNSIGIEVLRIVAIADKEEEIVRALDDAQKRADVILLTGGLGPTSDDITKKVLARYFNMPLVLNEEVLKDVERVFEHRKRPILEVNRLQAEVPYGCEIIRNTIGTAPGMCFWNNGKMILSMPGVPYEMEEMMRGFVLPKIETEFIRHHIVHKTVLTHGVGESTLADIIKDWEQTLCKEFISLAYLPSPGMVKLRLTLRGKEPALLGTMSDESITRLKDLIGELIFGFDDDSLEKIVGDLLKTKKATLGTAESCTGGFIAHLITSVPGSSEYFKGSIVSYSNEIKEKELHVNPESLKKYGAVSQKVVEEMATGAKKNLNVDYAVATSGIAGPDGGSNEKPVGTVWIAVATPQEVFSKKYIFGKNRKINIESASIAGLNMLRKSLLV